MRAALLSMLLLGCQAQLGAAPADMSLADQQPLADLLVTSNDIQGALDAMPDTTPGPDLLPSPADLSACNAVGDPCCSLTATGCDTQFSLACDVRWFSTTFQQCVRCGVDGAPCCANDTCPFSSNDSCLQDTFGDHVCAGQNPNCGLSGQPCCAGFCAIGLKCQPGDVCR